MKGKSFKAISVGFILLVSSLLTIVGFGNIRITAASNTKFETNGINVMYKTQEEIREYISKNPLKWRGKTVYSKTSTLKVAKEMEKVSEETFNYSLGMINQIRYIAGLGEIVVKDKTEYDNHANIQYKTVFNITARYDPEKGPKELINIMKNIEFIVSDSKDYEKVFDITKVSNKSVLHGFMSSLDADMIARQIYRRRILYPYFNSFTYWKDPNKNDIIIGSSPSDFVIDEKVGKKKPRTEYGVMWPAQTMPTEFFDVEYPWSISMGETIKEDNVRVTMTRERDNRKWVFSKEKSDGYFYVSNEDYGQVGCIIFWPEGIETYRDQDKYQVSITGLLQPVSYQVTFFDLFPLQEISIFGGKTSLNIGETIDLKVSLEPFDMLASTQIVWSSSDETIARVSSEGKVEGVSLGMAKIKATHVNSGLSDIKTIRIQPKKQQIIKVLQNTKNELNITYMKDTAVTGYQIVYATDANFTKNKKSKIISKSDKDRFIAKDLEKNTKYYIKVRSYYDTGGATIYGKYSTVHTITIK